MLVYNFLKLGYPRAACIFAADFYIFLPLASFFFVQVDPGVVDKQSTQLSEEIPMCSMSNAEVSLRCAWYDRKTLAFS